MRIIIKKVILTVICAILASNLLKAEEKYTLILAPESKFWIEGDSTLHKYEARATEIKLTGTAILENPVDSKQDLYKEIISNSKIKEFFLEIPVKKMKSGTPGLAGRMRRRLKYKECPEIIFSLQKYSAEKSTGTAGLFLIKSTGTILVANVERPYHLNFSADISTGGYISVKGEKSLLMTDFDIKPPVIIGLLRTKNEIKVKWELLLDIKFENKVFGKLSEGGEK